MSQRSKTAHSPEGSDLSLRKVERSPHFVTRLNSNEAVSAVSAPSNTQEVVALNPLTPIQELSALSRSSSTQFEGHKDTQNLFYELINERKDELKKIAVQVREGHMCKEDAETELLLTALCHSLQLSRQAATRVLPLLKESLSLSAELREGLHTLWSSDEEA